VTGDEFWLLLGFGVMTASLTALGAAGMTLLLGITGFLNFAYGEWLTIAAYLTYAFDGSLRMHLVVAAALAILIAGLLGPIADWIVFRPLTGRSPLILLVTSLGLSFILQNGVRAIWGVEILTLELPFDLLSPVLIGPFRFTRLNLILIVVAVVVMVALALLLNRTSLGRAMRAMADNRSLARVSGIPVGRVTTYTWFIGSALAGLSGVMLGMTNQLSAGMGFSQLLVIASAVIVGGLGNVYGALVAAFLLGIAMELSTAVIEPSLKPGVAFVLLILVLLYRPQGLFGKVVG
jgi:branched-subunit amino acid ABC-type transport system permease component